MRKSFFRKVIWLACKKLPVIFGKVLLFCWGRILRCSRQKIWGSHLFENAWGEMLRSIDFVHPRFFCVCLGVWKRKQPKGSFTKTILVSHFWWAKKTWCLVAKTVIFQVWSERPIWGGFWFIRGGPLPVMNRVLTLMKNLINGQLGL